MNIQYVPYAEIDKSRWDNCVRTATNGLIYAHSFYLDAMAKHWDALVLDDYAAVMPLTWNRKYSVYYLYQPAFTASLGVFGNLITAELVYDFLQHIPAKFKLWDIYLNPGNYFELRYFDLYRRVNFTLSLEPGYAIISKSYRDNTKRNIRKAEKLGAITRKGFPLSDVLALVKEQPGQYAGISDRDLVSISGLYQSLQSQGLATTYGVEMNGKLIASAAFFYDTQRAYYILVGNHPNGKTIGASHLLVDAFIRDHAGRQLLLDFEGSDIQSLAFFYSSFGAKEEVYPGLRYNQLPRLLKYFKK